MPASAARGSGDARYKLGVGSLLLNVRQVLIPTTINTCKEDDEQPQLPGFYYDVALTG